MPDQKISVRILKKPNNITIIQVYAPTTEDEEEIGSFYT